MTSNLPKDKIFGLDFAYVRISTSPSIEYASMNVRESISELRRIATWVTSLSSPMKIKSPGRGLMIFTVYFSARSFAVESSKGSLYPSFCTDSAYTFTTSPEQSIEPSGSDHQLCPPHSYLIPMYFWAIWVAALRIASDAGVRFGSAVIVEHPLSRSMAIAKTIILMIGIIPRRRYGW